MAIKENSLQRTSPDPVFYGDTRDFDTKLWEWGQELIRTGELGSLVESDQEIKSGKAA